MARLKNKGVRATFITLTYKGYPSNAKAKNDLHVFLQHIRRNFQSSSAVWRMEYQKRGSVHFHIIAFNLPYWHWTEILSTWKRISGQDVARVDVRLVRSRKGVMWYVSKYIAKVERGTKKTFLVLVPYLNVGRKWRKGRFWGYHNKRSLPLGQKLTGFLVDTGLIKRLSKAAWEIIGTDTQYGSISFHLFTQSAVSLWEMYMKIGGLMPDEYKDSLIFGRKYGYQFRDIGTAFVI